MMIILFYDLIFDHLIANPAKRLTTHKQFELNSAITYELFDWFDHFVRLTLKR